MYTSEINRCLLCKNARCQAACPIHTRIPEVMSLLKEGKKLEAQKLLFDHNPLSAICAIVCNHEVQCLGNCIRGIKGEPITFHKIEEEISNEYLMGNDFSCDNDRKGKVAIVGTGPVGISGAIFLSQQGYQVTIFEKNTEIGGVLRYGIPPFRLNKDVVNRYEQILVDLKVEIKTNVTIGVEHTLEQLRNEYDAVLLGIGAEEANKLNIVGEELQHVHYAIEYLRNPSAYELEGRVLVLGAGNVAMDAARTAKRAGYDTSIYYRKSFEDMKANPVEIKETIDDGIDFTYFQSPVEITEEGVIFCDSENITDENGRLQTKILEGTEHLVKCDSVIIAVSQKVSKIVSTNSSLEQASWGGIIVDENGKTNLANVFAAGDGVTGTRSVVEAVMDTKKVCEIIMQLKID